MQLIANEMSVTLDYFLEHSQRTMTLHSDEHKLLNVYRSLNEEGQKKLVDYADDLIGSGKYKNCDFNDLVEKET